MTSTISFPSRQAFGKHLYDRVVTPGMTGRDRIRAAILAAHVAATYPDDPISNRRDQSSHA